MFQLGRSEDFPLRDSDAGYSSNGSVSNSPKISKSGSSSYASTVDQVATNDENRIFSVADEIFSDIQSQSLTSASGIASTSFFDKSSLKAESYATINVIPSSSNLSGDSLHNNNSISFIANSSLKYAYINGEKVAIKLVSNPNLGSSSDCYHISQNTLNYVCSKGKAEENLSLSSLSSETSGTMGQGVSQSPQHFNDFSGDMDFLDTLTSEEQNLNELVTICNQRLAGPESKEEMCSQNSSINSPETDDSESFFGESGVMDTSMLMLPILSHQNSCSNEANSPLDGDGMQKISIDLSGNCSAQELDQSQVSPSPCIDDDVDTKTLSSSLLIGDVTRAPSLSGQVETRFTTEDEAWRSYLENPLTAATSAAMMSIHGDEDSAAALGILYDYYKVPREKRILSCQLENIEQTERRHSVHGQESSLDAAATNDLLLGGSGKRSRGHSGSSSNDQDSCINEVVSVGSESLSLGHSDSHIATEVSSDYLHIGKTNFESVPKRSLPSLDTSFCDVKHSPSQVLSFGDCMYNSAANLHRKRQVSNRNLDAEQLELQLPSAHTLHPQLLSTSTINLPFFTSRNDQLAQEYSGETFEYTMEAPKSLKQKDGEPTMSYINKGQFYCISLRECFNQQQLCPRSSRVTSVVQVVFGDSKPEEEQIRHWRYWHARQHTAKQRIIDIADYKESCMISEIDEFAHNAIAFTWDVADVAKIFISCNCLSTDFSAQKGIKGLPLLLQIDTYAHNRRTGTPNHRGVCQLKVFCDKGAERKIRDEERKALRKKQKNRPKSTMGSQSQMPLSPADVKPSLRSPIPSPPPQSATNVGGQNVAPQKKMDIVQFMPVSDRRSAVYFVPEIYGSSRSHTTSSPGARIQVDGAALGSVLTPTSSAEVEQILSGQVDSFESLRSPSKRSHSLISSEEGDFPPSKLPRLWESESTKKVLLYIRKENDEVFDGVMLKEPTLQGLKEALQEKYNLPAEKMTKLLKKSKKGILVNLDDNIVRHYSNEDTFVIDIASETSNNDVMYKVTLSVV